MKKNTEVNEYMINEYNTLRSEILNAYSEQTKLVFATAIMPAIILFSRNYTKSETNTILALILIIIIGITFKSIANYSRIYRIGTYLSVVHEQGRQGLDEPNPLQASWHSSWRRVKEREGLWGVGNDGPWSESAFLLFVSSIGWLLAIQEYDFKDKTILSFFSQYSLSLVLSIILLCTLYFLIRVFHQNKKYKDFFQKEINL